MNFKKTIFKNGLTLITIPLKDSPSVTVLVTVSAGSKYENKGNNGISHFLEHMCFKGTEKRPKAIDISIELDRIGAQSNAFTSQEFTGYYAKSHPMHFATILGVVSDIYQNPIFDSAEIEKEKGVIIEEINMYEDLPHRSVHDVFMEALYGDQPAGWSIAGTKENVSHMKREDFVAYRDHHYVASATTVVVSGNFDETHIVSQVEKAFEHIPTTNKETKVLVSEIQSGPVIKIKHKETDQTHIVLGVRTYKASDDKNMALRVLSSILGGGMSSRLFVKLREEMGVGYYVRSGVDEFTDHGYMAVSTGVDVNRVPEVITAVLGELKKLTEGVVPPDEIEKSKEYIIGNMYLGLESSDALAEFYVIQHLLGEKMVTPDEFAIKIKNVTAEDVHMVAQEIIQNSNMTLAIVGNIKDQEHITKIFNL